MTGQCDKGTFSQGSIQSVRRCVTLKSSVVRIINGITGIVFMSAILMLENATYFISMF